MADHVNPCARGHWRPVELTGWLLPWRNGQPVLIELPGAPASAVPVFDAPEDLRRCMADVGVTNYTIKQVTDGIDFAASVEEGGAIVAANPRPTGQGNRLDVGHHQRRSGPRARPPRHRKGRPCMRRRLVLRRPPLTRLRAWPATAA